MRRVFSLADVVRKLMSGLFHDDDRFHGQSIDSIEKICYPSETIEGAPSKSGGREKEREREREIAFCSVVKSFLFLLFLLRCVAADAVVLTAAW